ncbi:alpha/beta hydrolase-fold protein [Lysobacter sp. HA18]
MKSVAPRVRVAFLLLAALLAKEIASADETSPPHERLTLTSAALHEVRRINVYLPPSYDADPGRRYPVLYMLDGGEAEDFPHVTRAADRLIRQGAVRPFVIVGIENTVRRRDMTGPTQDAADLKVTSSPGGAPSFRRFLASELIPVVESRYRLTRESAVIGESLAGLFVIDTLMQEPDLFDAYVAIDPSLWWNRREAIRALPERLAAFGQRHVRVLLTAGGEQSNRPEVDAFSDSLSRAAPKGLLWHYVPRPDLRHDNIYRGMEEQLLTDTFGFATRNSGRGDTLGNHPR